MSIRICVDVGGTFTDLAAVNDKDGQLRIFKTSTTPKDPNDGMINGLQLVADYYGLSMSEFLQQCSSCNRGTIVYGTTIFTNAIIQKKVAKVGLLCTKGHQDILTFREAGKEDAFDLNVEQPQPYVPRYLTLAIHERIDSQGNIVAPLDEFQVIDRINQLKAFDVDIIAIALLWSIANPAHENWIAEIIEREWPGQSYVLSHKINPIIREYRRTISTVINASLTPLANRYLDQLDERLRQMGYLGDLSIISSFGGILSLKDVEEKPIYCVDSGPTGAPVAGLMYSQMEQKGSSIVTCDMGGTSFDVSLITDGIIEQTDDAKVGDDYLGVRKVNTESIGAGGGSIAWVDAAGLLRVGPDSMGAEPGPACYMRGGEKATVTDANLVMGYLGTGNLLGGRMQLNRELSETVIQQDVAAPLGINLHEAAFSIWNTVNTNMTDAIKKITSWVGIDPQDYVFVSGGGAGGIHIIPMMIELGIKDLIIPRAAGTFSAVGGLTSDIVAEFQQSLEWNTVGSELDEVNNSLKKLEKQANDFLSSNKVDTKDRMLQFSVDACYYQQPWGMTIPLRKNRFYDKTDVTTLLNDFHEIHYQKRGSKESGQWIACSTWRVKATGKTSPIQFPKMYSVEMSEEPKKRMRMAYFKELDGLIETPVYKGADLKVSQIITAPGIIEQDNTTIVVYPGSEVIVSDYENYLMRLTN